MNIVRKQVVSRRSAGFTIIELMIAVTVFLIIGGAAMSLFKQHASLFNDQQYQIGLNVSLRNALSQIESDVVNAGTGWYNSADISSWPIGVTIINNIAGGAACHPAGSSTYNASCFDTLNVVVPDPTTPPGRVYVTPGTDTSCSTPVFSSSGLMTVVPTGATTATTLASGFTANSQVVFIHVTTSYTQMTTAILSANATVAGTTVNLTYGATNGVGSASGPGSNSAAPVNDRLNLTTNPDLTINPSPLTSTFCNGTDWVVKLAPISYSVDTITDPTNPTLVRSENGQNSPVASQVIGFKVGAATVTLNGNAAVGSSAQYCYNDASNVLPCYANKYDEIRSVRVSVIGRTPPKLYSNSNVYSNTLFTNSFDGQPYKIQSLSVIVNPRNLSMND